MNVTQLTENSWYICSNEFGSGYVCLDHKIRLWDDMLKEFGDTETNRLTLFKSVEEAQNALNYIKTELPEYFV